jgi:Tfp pilus assembly protein PilO
MENKNPLSGTDPANDRGPLPPPIPSGGKLPPPTPTPTSGNYQPPIPPLGQFPQGGKLPPQVPPGGKLPPPTPQPGKFPPPTPPNKKSGVSKVLSIIVVILALALIGSIIWIYQLTKQSEEDLAIANAAKQEVIANLEQLKIDYGELKVSNDTINEQLISERKKIDVLMERIKKTDATNKARMRQYEKEITNLKSLLTGYVHQIDSLNLLTRTLREENTKVKTEISQSKKRVAELSEERTALQSMVEKGGELKTRDLTVTGLTSRDKAAVRARQTEQLKICLTLVENNLAKRGPRNVYARIKSPDGSLLSTSVTNLFTPVAGGARLIYSAMREVDYNGEDLDVCLYYKDAEFMPGAYDIEVFLDGAYVGSAQLILK